MVRACVRLTEVRIDRSFSIVVVFFYTVPTGEDVGGRVEKGFWSDGEDFGVTEGVDQN